MTTVEKDNLKFRLDSKELTAEVIESPKAKGTISIPRHIIYRKKKYIIKAIGQYAFSENEIDSITFPNDSEVERFESYSFYLMSIKKLQIPSSLKYIEEECFDKIRDLVDIEVSPQNKYFTYENELLLGKSEENLEEYDILITASFNIQNAIIPSSIRHINTYCFLDHNNLESIIFEKNSILCEINESIISKSLKKLNIPKSVTQIGPECFQKAQNLIDIEISKSNKVFKYVNNTFLMTKKDETSKDFDVILFCRRDVKQIEILKNVKEIASYSFSCCYNLNSITFEKSSSLEMIGEGALEATSISNIVIPGSVKVLNKNAFSSNTLLQKVQILGEDVKIESMCFLMCLRLESISLPNAKKFSMKGNSFGDKLKIFLRTDAKCEFDDESEIKKHISYIQVKPEEPSKKEEKKEKVEIEDHNENVNPVQNEKHVENQKPIENENPVEEKNPEKSKNVEENSSKCCILI